MMASVIARHPAVHYSLLCSTVPVAWIDRVSLRAGIDGLPFRFYVAPVFHPLRGKKYGYALDEVYRPAGFYVRGGWALGQRCVWLDCYRVPIVDSIRSAYVGALVHLSDYDLLGLGSVPSAREVRAEQVLSHFVPAAVEVRFDLCGDPAGQVKRALSRYKRGRRFELVPPGDPRRWDRGYFPSVYTKRGDPDFPRSHVLRAEMTLLSRSLRGVSLAEVLQPTTAVLERLAPVALAKWDGLAKGRRPKPEVRELLGAVRPWVSLIARAREMNMTDRELEQLVVAGEWDKTF